MGLGWWVCFAPKSVGWGVQVLGWMELQVPYPNFYYMHICQFFVESTFVAISLFV